jgi:hypothetical protein
MVMETFTTEAIESTGGNKFSVASVLSVACLGT